MYYCAVALRSQLPNDLSVALARGYRSLARMPPSELPLPPEQLAAASSSAVLNTRTYAPGTCYFLCILYGHVTLKTPVPVRSPKLNNVECG
jgi:hypothetical protein